MKKAVFLDRDGTINVDVGYAHRIDQWQWIQGSREAILRLKAAGYLVVVVTNQSGIARGMYGAADVEALHAFANHQLGGAVDAFYYCRHDDADACDCRKPQPGMLRAGAKDLGIDLAQSWMVGDKAIDVAAGIAAGARGLRVLSGMEVDIAAGETLGVDVFSNLATAVDRILA